MEHIVFLTGRLAQPSLEKVLASIQPPAFTWEVREIGLQVAALMTADMMRRRDAATSRRCPRTTGCRCSAAPRS